MKHPYLVFDLDGTLVDSLPGIAIGLNAALRALGKPEHPEEAVRLMIGEGARNLCAKALGYADEEEASDEELRALLAEFKIAYRDCWHEGGTACYAGVLDMLTSLRETPARMALLSNKPHEMTTLMVDALMPEHRLSPVLGYQEGVFPRKPHPAALQHIAQSWGVETRELLLIGDSIHDAHCAHNAGCQLALVGWGYARQDALRRYAQEQGVPLFGSMEELRGFVLSP